MAIRSVTDDAGPGRARTSVSLARARSASVIDDRAPTSAWPYMRTRTTGPGKRSCGRHDPHHYIHGSSACDLHHRRHHLTVLPEADHNFNLTPPDHHADRRPARRHGLRRPASCHASQATGHQGTRHNERAGLKRELARRTRSRDPERVLLTASRNIPAPGHPVRTIAAPPQRKALSATTGRG